MALQFSFLMLILFQVYDILLACMLFAMDARKECQIPGTGVTAVSCHEGGGNQAYVFWMSSQRSCLPSYLSSLPALLLSQLTENFTAFLKINNVLPILTFLLFVFYLLQTHHITGTNVKELTEELGQSDAPRCQLAKQPV